MHSIKTTTFGIWCKNYIFQTLLSIHSCKALEEGEENVKYLSKQYAVAGK